MQCSGVRDQRRVCSGISVGDVNSGFLLIRALVRDDGATISLRCLLGFLALPSAWQLCRIVSGVCASHSFLKQVLQLIQ